MKKSIFGAAVLVGEILKRGEFLGGEDGGNDCDGCKGAYIGADFDKKLHLDG